MPLEVYTGAQPGRPRLLLMIVAGLLALTLGLAWLQVHAAHALGREQQVGDTPLRVRLPTGWQPDPRNPHAFILPVAERSPRGSREFGRHIVFEFTRLSAFQSAAQLLRQPGLRVSGELGRLARARLGRYDAVQVHEVVPVQIGRARFRSEILTRFTCLPRGHLIRVTYEPLVELRPADLEIFEEVCQTLRVDDPTLDRAPQEYLADAGLTFALEPGWNVVGTDFAQVPGVFLSGLADESPAWAIGVLRTWLANGRTPRDLLRDLAAQQWLIFDVERLVQEEQHAGGGTITTIRHPEFGAASPTIPAAYVVQQSPARAVIIFVFSGPREAALADAAAGRIAAALEIAPLKAFSVLTEAEAAGIRLVADLQKNGPAARWGRETVETTYRQADSDELVVVRRGAVDRDPAQGYQGSQWRRTGRTQEERLAWTLSGQAATYQWQADFFSGTPAARVTVQVREQRTLAGGPVIRRLLVDEGEQLHWTFTPGPAFVPPPVESIVQGWVARDEIAAALIDASTGLGTATHSELLRHLPPDGQYPRVLIQQDFWPLGAIEAYDDARAETQYEIYPAAEYRRVK